MLFLVVGVVGSRFSGSGYAFRGEGQRSQMSSFEC